MPTGQQHTDTERGEESSATGLGGRRRWVLGVALSATAVSVLGLGAAQFIKSPAQAVADSSAPPPSVLSAPVEQRVLTDSVVVRGSVTAGQVTQVTPAVKGEDVTSSVVTKLPVSAGDPVKAGQLLMEVSGRPVIALSGTLPVYRDLKPGTEGDDVLQLQRALAAVGHTSGGDTPGYFGPGTKSALTALYASVGYDPLPAQPDSDAQIESAQKDVRSAERALEDVSAAKDASSGKDASVSAGREKERAQEDVSTARDALTELVAKSGPMLSASEVVFLERFPAHVDAVTTRVGATVSGSAMTLSSGAPVVNGYLKAAQKNLVRVGQKVQIYSELTGVSAEATVVTVSDSVAQEQSAGSGADETDGDPGFGGGSTRAGYPMVVAPVKKLDASLIGQDVRLTVEAATTRGKVLAVPVSAITAGADGKAFVAVLGPNDSRTRVPVETGTAGDGYVEIRPTGGGELASGARVIVGVRSTEEGR